MAYTTIDDSSVQFQATAYTGTGASQTVTNGGNSDLQPDLLWIKNRGAGYAHALFDSNRGLGSSNPNMFETNTNVAENNNQNWVSAVSTDSFTLGVSEHNISNSGSTYVAWQWKAAGGTTASNTDGDLTSTTQVNSTAGFSIVTYTGKDPIEPLDVGHGLGEVPHVIIVKNRDRSASWAVYHKDLTSPAENRYLQLNTSNAESANSTFWRNEAPTTTIVKTGENSSVNVANEEFVMYCWVERQGFSKFGKYMGNGDANGTFVYTGFKPACVITKETSSAGGNWRIFDNARIGFNEDNYRLTPNEASAESTAVHLDLLSNGFKFRNTGTSYNGSGDQYIYMAWAENPFVTSTTIPTTAR
tara:strand:- start:140 stop:1213 length:1074 start_codon:yes stop_codon:yes gene_type:complete